MPESTELVPIEDNLPELTREEKFISNLLICNSAYEAGIRAGYSDSYCRTALPSKISKNPKYLEKIIQYWKAHELIDNVPQAFRIIKRHLRWLETDAPESEIPKSTAMLKQIFQRVGMMSQDVAQQAPTINIKEVRNLMLNVSQDKVDNQQPKHEDSLND